MKNTSLLFLLGNAKRKPSVESPKAHWVKRHACFRGYRGHKVMPPNRLFSSCESLRTKSVRIIAHEVCCYPSKLKEI